MQIGVYRSLPRKERKGGRDGKDRKIRKGKSVQYCEKQTICGQPPWILHILNPNLIPPSLAEKRKATPEDSSSNLMNPKKSRAGNSSDEETGRIEPEEKPEIQISPCFLPSDVTLVVEDKRLYVNKDLLSSASLVFKTWLKKEWQENDTKNELKFPDKTYEEMNTFLKCLLPICDDQVTVATLDVVLPLADEYQTESLLENCEEVIKKHVESVSERNIYIPPSRVITYLRWIDKYNLQGLETCVVRLASFLKTEELEVVSDYKNVCLRMKLDVANARAKLLDNIYVSKIEEIERKMNILQIPVSPCYMAEWKEIIVCMMEVFLQFEPRCLYASGGPLRRSGATLSYYVDYSCDSSVKAILACLSISDRFELLDIQRKAIDKLKSLEISGSKFENLWSKHYSVKTADAHFRMQRLMSLLCKS